tara:strand:- start:397 stop:702 length:306 start_codon:yes stop_codon:yes gene_type:complete
MTPGKIAGIKDLPPDLIKSKNNQKNELWTIALVKRVNDMLKNGNKDILLKLDKEFEKTLIQQSLNFTEGKRIEASKRLGIGRNTLTRKIKELNIDEKILPY